MSSVEEEDHFGDVRPENGPACSNAYTHAVLEVNSGVCVGKNDDSSTFASLCSTAACVRAWVGGKLRENEIP